MTRSNVNQKCTNTPHLGPCGWPSMPNIFPFSKSICLMENVLVCAYLCSWIAKSRCQSFFSTHIFRLVWLFLNIKGFMWLIGDVLRKILCIWAQIYSLHMKIQQTGKMLKITDFVNFGPKYLGPQIFPRNAVCGRKLEI